MGSYIEINDTLQLTKEQGFPERLDIETHLTSSYVQSQFVAEIFDFRLKPSIRIYHAPPVRTFLVENKNGKWIYWGLVHVIEVTHDLVNKTTSGKFKIVYINTPMEMKKAFELIDRRSEMSYFDSSF